MLRFDIITIFPEVVEPYVKTSILARAQKKRLVNIGVHDLRRWTKDKHRTVDDKPYGGGPGMILKLEPIFKAVTALKKRGTVPSRRAEGLSPRGTQRRGRTRVVLMSASGKPFTQRKAEQYAKKYDHIILICGRYEGVDARVAQYVADEELSVGPYVLTGGELPALTVVDAVTRLVPGVIKPESLAEESFSFAVAPRRPARREAQSGSCAVGVGRIGEYPQYTRPDVFYPDQRNKKIAWKVPKILLSGDHEKIAAWRQKHLRGEY